MICESSCDTMLPRQPFMVKCSDTYYKKVINQLGISHFYQFRQNKNSHQIETSVPDGCTDIIFHYDSSGSDIGADIYGSPLSPHAFEMVPGSYYFGVRFLPGNLPVVLKISMAETINQVISLENMSKYVNLAEMIANQKNFQSQIDLFLGFHEKNLGEEQNKGKNAGPRKFLVNYILNRNGNVRVNDLADVSNYSIRYVNRIFKEEMGIPPKTFCRIIRFQKCLSDICNLFKASEEPSLGFLSSKLGYADESHMIRDFKEYTNRTPHAFWKELSGFKYQKRLKEI